MNQDQWIDKLKKEGYGDLTVVDIGPNEIKPNHTHEQATMHVILKGELTIEDKDGKRSFKEGDRVDFPSGTTHTAIFGSDGCRMIVGTKKG